MEGKWMLGITLLVFIVASGCRPGAKPDAGPSVPAQPKPASAGAPWEIEWQRTVATAKEEGTVVVASSLTQVQKSALQKGLSDRYGINLELMIARPAQFVPRIDAERRLGIYSTDAIIAGISTVLATMAPAGELEPLDPLLILPEVKNEKLWLEGHLRFIDQNHNLLGMASIPKRPVGLNTEMVKTGEIRSYRDLLNPRWKGKIEISDPTIGGGGNGVFQAIADYIMDLDYLRELGKQEPIIVRDNRLMVEWLARGKYPISLGIDEDSIREFQMAGAPIMVMSPKEGTFVTISGFGLSVLKSAPHPAAVRLFINWLLSKEGQTVLSRSAAVPSLRVDVPKDHLPPELNLSPEERYFWPDLDPNIAEKREQARKTAEQLWGHLIK